MESEVASLKQEIDVLEKFLESIESGTPSDQVAALKGASMTVDISGPLKPYFRRMFSGDQLHSNDSVMNGRKVDVTVEVIGEGERITSAVAVAKMAKAVAVDTVDDVDSGKSQEEDDEEEENEQDEAPVDEEEKTFCSVCEKPFGDGVKAWSANDALFCQDCFCCKTCGISLQSEDLFNVGDFVYCSKHNPSVEACGKCGEALLSGKVIAAMGKKFHSHCFSCGECGQTFNNNETIYVSGDKVFCERHAPSTEEEEEEGDEFDSYSGD